MGLSNAIRRGSVGYFVRVLRACVRYFSACSRNIFRLDFQCIDYTSSVVTEGIRSTVLYIFMRRYAQRIRRLSF